MVKQYLVTFRFFRCRPVNCQMAATERELAVCDVIISGKSYISFRHCAPAYKLVRSVCIPMGFHLRASFTEEILLLLACYMAANRMCIRFSCWKL